MIMTINPLTPSLAQLLTTGTRNPAGYTESTEGSFADILTGTFANAVQQDNIDKTSALELLIGESDDFAGLMIDMQKAELSLNLALQIRNKFIDAYNEIIRMQV